MEKVFEYSLKKLINNHDVISFDVFDTLIKRNCNEPKDIFYIVEKQYNKLFDKKIRDFYQKRVKAEHEARLKHFNFEDITIDEIYACIDFEKNVAKKLMKLEIECELDICQTNHVMFNIYKYCLENNKKIICTSDMYLPRDIIKKILNNSGYFINDIYVSSEIRKTKISGNLFEYIVDDLKIKKSSILHIGDSWKADFLAPIKKGILAFHIKKHINNCKFIKINKNLPFEDLTTNILISYINNNSMLYDDEYEKMGFEIIGPLCLLFCMWIKEIQKNNNIKNLLFCARDMKMLQQIFNSLYGNDIENHYFYVSRKSTYLPYLYLNQDFEYFKDLIPSGRRKISISELLDLYNIFIDNEDLKDNLPKFNLNFDEKYDFEILKNDKNLADFYNEIILKKIKKDGKIQYNNFLKYLNNIDCDDGTAIVDLGWRGTTQNMVIEITKKEIYGLYFGLHSLNGKNLKDNYFTFLFNGKENGYSDKIYSFMSLCELYLSALHGSTISYTSDDSKPYILNKSANENNNFIEKIQNSSLEFNEKILKIKKYLSFTDSKIIIDNFINIGTNPTIQQAKILGNIYTENIKTRKLCECRGLLFYLFHIKQFKNDFMDSEWKIGFLKKMFKVKLPYYNIYIFLKNIGK